MTHKLLQVTALGMLLLPHVFSAHAQAPGSEAKKQDLVLTLETSVTYTLGRSVPITVGLQNQGRERISVRSLETASLNFLVSDVSSQWHGIAGGNTQAIEQKTADGSSAVEWVTVPQTALWLEPGQKISRALELSSAIGAHLDAGDYTLKVTYEDTLNVEKKFRVVISETETIPALIEQAEKGKRSDQVWARNTLFILTGRPEVDPDAQPDTEPLQSVRRLRSWWQQNRSMLKLRNGRFVMLDR